MQQSEHPPPYKSREVLVIDIETENTGADIMADNKRIISVQIGDTSQQELYYADAKESIKSLSVVPTRINSLVANGALFAGYNLKGFDLFFLKQFLGIEIPDANVLELRDMDGVQRLQQRTGQRSYRLEEVCSEYEIVTEHKRLMDERALPFRVKPEILAQANMAARKLVVEKGWSFDFSLKYTLDKISGGHAIFDAYKEFVQKDGSKETLFYKYAVGDALLHD